MVVVVLAHPDEVILGVRFMGERGVAVGTEEERVVVLRRYRSIILGMIKIFRGRFE